MDFTGHLPGVGHKYLRFKINFCAVPLRCCLRLSHLPRAPVVSDGSAPGLLCSGLSRFWRQRSCSCSLPAARGVDPLSFPGIYCSYCNYSGGAQSWGDVQEIHPTGIPRWHCCLAALPRRRSAPACSPTPQGSSRGYPRGNTGKGLTTTLQPPWEPLAPEPGSVGRSRCLGFIQKLPVTELQAVWIFPAPCSSWERSKHNSLSCLTCLQHRGQCLRDTGNRPPGAGIQPGHSTWKR